ncbi:hypothetical protein Salat_2091000 [Sesamum alatum]|uniref:Uncharacterized protein n=1 Tax=Sesamum alatum TaxID=300844 RepID=A0AAE1Y0E0_9LAMI|nr:hypothetical protein Salat_2091000 [Sesamum alatum]
MIDKGRYLQVYRKPNPSIEERKDFTKIRASKGASGAEDASSWEVSKSTIPGAAEISTLGASPLAMGLLLSEDELESEILALELEDPLDSLDSLGMNKEGQKSYLLVSRMSRSREKSNATGGR